MSKNEMVKKDLECSSNIWREFLSDIRHCYFERNFGTLSKSEFEILLFHYYLRDKHTQSKGEYISDYEIGKELGLTTQRVRSLREREALKFGMKTEWKQQFYDCFKFAHYDPSGDVKIPIPDVNVMKEARNYLEQRGLFDEYQRNPKVFQCSLEVLVAVCLSVDHEGDDNLCKTILDMLRSHKNGQFSCAVKEQEHPIKSAISKAISDAAVKSVRDIISLIPGVGNACGELFESLAKNIKFAH